MIRTGLLVALLLAGCGTTTRLTVGPTYDTNDRIGVAVRVSRGWASPPTRSLESPSAFSLVGTAMAEAGQEPARGTVSLRGGVLSLPSSLDDGWVVRVEGGVGFRLTQKRRGGVLGFGLAAVRRGGEILSSPALWGAEVHCDHHGVFGQRAGAAGQCGLGLALETLNIPRPRGRPVR